MKKKFTILLSLCLLIFACKKDSTMHNTLTGKVTNVTFSIGFSQQIVNLNVKFPSKGKSGFLSDASAQTLQNQIDVIYYGVYDATGKGVHIITQYSSDANFGSYTDDLKPGTYTVVVAAGKGSVLLGPDNYGSAASTLSTDVISCGIDQTNPSSPAWNEFVYDAFYEKLPLTVGASDSNLSFALNRITSELVVNIDDAIPAGAYSIDFAIKNSSDRFNIGTATAVPYDFTTNYQRSGYANNQFTSARIGTKNFQLSTFFLYANTPFSVFVTAYTNNNADPVLAGKNIPSVTAQVNAETLLSGNLFGGNGTNPTGGFQAVIDSTWSGTTVVPFSVIKSQKIKR